MSVAAILLLVKLLGPALIQETGPFVANWQQGILLNEQVQIAYYNALTAYYQTLPRHKNRIVKHGKARKSR